MGATRPTEAAPGSLRHDFAVEVGGISSCFDTPENGTSEVELWFKQKNLLIGARWDRWVFEK